MNIDTSSDYFIQTRREHAHWKEMMLAEPSLLTTTTRGIQRRINKVIPEGIHRVVTKAVKETTKATISGSAIFTLPKEEDKTFQEREKHVQQRISFYANSSATEGAITGFGGFISGMVDFPLWLSLKMKMLFEVATFYGFNIDDYRERLYILYIFQLTFSAPETRRKLFAKMQHWNKQLDTLPPTYQDFDWKTFQLEYRDHVDLAKLIQLIPGIGAVAGAVVNHKYTHRLGENAMECYRMRFPAFRDKVSTDDL